MHPIPERIGYCPSKAGVIMLTKCIALEYAPKVRVNCVLPGLVRTPMIEQRFQESFEEMQHMPDYDYLIINDVLDKAIRQLEQIVAVERLRVSRNQEYIDSFLNKGGDEA